MNINNKNQLLNVKEKLLAAIKDVSKENYEKRKEDYYFKLEEEEYIASLTKDGIEFRVPTLKWLPGSYEPIEGSELYLKIEYEELTNLSGTDVLNKLTQAVNSLRKHKR